MSGRPHGPDVAGRRRAAADQVRANTAFGLALVVCEHGADRLGRCQAAGCDRVYADVQRGPRRRYCSRACQNGSSVVAFRARRVS